MISPKSFEYYATGVLPEGYQDRFDAFTSQSSVEGIQELYETIGVNWDMSAEDIVYNANTYWSSQDEQI